MIRSDTVRKGEIAVQRTILRAIELGCTVCRPCLEGSRYDLVIERRQGVLERVQVKYCDARPGSSGSYALSLTRHTGGRARRIYPYSAREVDAIVALLASDDMLVWLPAPVWDGRSTLNIRTRPARNGQRSGIRMATDFRW
jgi:hypothetical protein